MDHQQQRMWQLCWLAGVIDSDGSITVLDVPNRNKTKRRYVPRVNIVNTNKLLIEEAARILDQFGVGRHVSTRRGDKIGWRMRGQINIDGFKRVVKLLTIIEPLLIAKKEQAKLILALWESRKDCKTRSGYRDKELEFLNRVRYLNQTGVTFCSETNTPDTP